MRFSPVSLAVNTFAIGEATLTSPHPQPDPFRSVEITATLITPMGERKFVRGFCDREDGTLFRVRFMPMIPGKHDYEIRTLNGIFRGHFMAEESGHEGLIEVNPDYPFHFRHSQSGRPWFWNSTTAYILMGLENPTTATKRFEDKGINRIRVSLCPSRQSDGGRWHEPQVCHREDFTYLYGPWPCRNPSDQANPQFDVTQFDVRYWQKFERMLASTKLRVQVIFFTDAQEDWNYPFDRKQVGTDPDERRYFQYAVARLASFYNVEWCVTNEWELYRPNEWCDILGELIAEEDPYGHLCAVHGHGHYPFRKSAWSTHALFQSWDEHGSYVFMLKNREEQLATGRPIPQINEEYGYEDHYPVPWGNGHVAPYRNADSRRRLAWEITMAGAYQTTGESAANGVGGWINGAGDDSMQMLDGYRIVMDFFVRFDWYRLAPRPDLIHGGYLLCVPGERYIAYLPHGGSVEIHVEDGEYEAEWFNPRTGQYFPSARDSRTSPDEMGDWVLTLTSAIPGVQ